MADFIGVRISSVSTQLPRARSSHSRSQSSIHYTEPISTSPGFQGLPDDYPRIVETFPPRFPDDYPRIVETFPPGLPPQLHRRPDFVESESTLNAPHPVRGSFYRQVSPNQGDYQHYEHENTNGYRTTERRPRDSSPSPTPLARSGRGSIWTGFDGRGSRTPVRSQTFVVRDHHDAEKPEHPQIRTSVPYMDGGRDEDSSRRSSSRRRQARLRRRQSADSRLRRAEQHVDICSDAVEYHEVWAQSIRHTLGSAEISLMPLRDYDQLIAKLRYHENLRQDAACALRIAELRIAQSNLRRNSHHHSRSRARHTQSRHVRPEHPVEASPARSEYSDSAGMSFDSRSSSLTRPWFSSDFVDEPEELPRDPHDGQPREERRSHRHEARTGRKETSRSRRDSRDHRPRSTAPPSPVLEPKEVKLLFERYNDEWQKLSPSDSNVPFPASGLRASALSNHRSLRSPYTTDPPSTWSPDTIMQANTQAFFLHAVDLTPRYTIEAHSRRILCSFDLARASDAQIKDLLAVLKKEKVRWHSDRVGRRNDGLPGLNEELQRDERVRAVFHAVCELMEFVQAAGRS